MYVIHPDHRNGNWRKSQWTISESEERECFAAAEASRWLIDDLGWGLYPTDGKPDWVGVCANRSRRSLIAKFVGVGSSNSWHGYPADHMNNRQDIPPPRILRMWLSVRLPPARIRKIAKGQPCNP